MPDDDAPEVFPPYPSMISKLIREAPPEDVVSALSFIGEERRELLRSALDPEREFGVRYKIVIRHEYACSTEAMAKDDVAGIKSDRPDWRPVLIARVPGRKPGPWEEVEDG